MAAPEESAVDQLIREFKKLFQPILALRLPEIAFQSGYEEELERRIVLIIDGRLAADKIPLGQQLRSKLIESLMADIALAKKERFGLR